MILFFRSGGVTIGRGYFTSAGAVGGGWSSQSNSANISTAYAVSIYEHSLILSNDTNRYYAFPLRCLARQ